MPNTSRTTARGLGRRILRRATATGIALLAAAQGASASDAGCVLQVASPDLHGLSEASADCRWAVPHEYVVDIVRDHGGIDDVLSSVSESTVLADGRVLQVHSMGWIAADRQVTLRFHKRSLAGEGLRSEFQRAHEQQPLAPGRVETTIDEGWWEIHPDGEGGTHLRYAVRYDAGGNLKPWLVRRFQKMGIATSMREIREAAESAAKSQLVISPVSAAAASRSSLHGN